MSSAMESVKEGKVVTLKPVEATPSTFKEYGQVVEASPDGEGFGPHDAQLDLSKGTPRFSLLNQASIFHQHINVLSFFSNTHFFPLVNSPLYFFYLLVLRFFTFIFFNSPKSKQNLFIILNKITPANNTTLYIKIERLETLNSLRKICKNTLKSVFP